MSHDTLGNRLKRVLFAFLTGCLGLASSHAFQITSAAFGTNGTFQVQYQANTNLYYALYRGTNATNINALISVAAGTNGSGQLSDTNAPASAAFYRVGQIDNSPTNLVINEIDYDQPSPPSDNMEFVELFNGTSASINLTGLALIFINGANNTEYLRVNLSGTLAAGQYLVACSTNVTVAAGAVVVPFTTSVNVIQNGSPDGVALFDLINHRIVDALSYTGSITAAVITGETGTFNLVEGTVLNASVADSNTIVGSLIRNPNGMDSNNANNDWKFTTTPTPGSANVLTP